MKNLILVLTLLVISTSFIGYTTIKKVLSKNQINESVKIDKIDLSEKFNIKGEVNVITITKNKMSYSVINKNHRNYDFYINANYFMVDNTPVGEVKVNGKTIKKRDSGGSFFTSNGGKPKFYHNNRPNTVLYSSQTHTPIIMNGVSNNKIFNKKWAKYKLPRMIIGENKNGDIVIIHTIGNTRCSINDFHNISKSQGLINSLMFDGGASIEVGVSYKNVEYKYQIVSDIQRKIGNVPTPSVFIVGTFN
jgi:exopolysaccharide biosynthesis protein